MKIIALRNSFRLIMCLSLLLVSLSSIHAQDIPDVPTVYVCVTPQGDEVTSYVIEIRDTSAFGLIIPQDATVQVYTNSSYSIALFTIVPDAPTGGYRTLETLAQVNAFQIIPAQSPCVNNADYRDILLAQPFKTIPLVTSSNHALVFQNEGTDLLENPFRRVIAFTFYVNEEQANWKNLQLIQISETEPFLNIRLPYIEAGTPFVVIGNKDFGLSQSLQSTVPPDFSRERPSDVRSFVYTDLDDLYGVNIFDVLKKTKARIYPNSGLVDTYRGTYLRLSLAPDMAQRDLPFEPGGLVQSLEDVEAQYVSMNYLDDNPLRVAIDYEKSAMGRIRESSVLRVVEVEADSGQLVIAVDDDRQAIIQSWLVEVVERDE